MADHPAGSTTIAPATTATPATTTMTSTALLRPPSSSSSSALASTGAVAMAMSDAGQEQLLQQLLARKAAMVTLARQRASVARAADAMLASANAEKEKVRVAKVEADASRKLSSLQQNLPASSPTSSGLDAQPGTPLSSVKKRPQGSTLQSAIAAAKAKKATVEASAFSLMPSFRPTPTPGSAAVTTDPAIKGEGDGSAAEKQAAAAAPSPRTATLIQLRPVVPVFKTNNNAPATTKTPAASTPLVVGYELQPGVGLRVGEVVECMYGDSSPPTFFPGVIEEIHPSVPINTSAQAGPLALVPLANQTPSEPLYDVRYDDGMLRCDRRREVM